MEAWEPPPKPSKCSHPIYSNYKNLVYLGRVPGGANYTKTPYFRELHPYANRVSNLEYFLQLSGDTYYVVKPTEENVNFTISTFEQRPPLTPTSPLQSKCFDYSLAYFDSIYGHLFEDCVATNEEVHEYIEFCKSSGYTGTFSGFRTKGDLVKSPQFNTWFHGKHHYNETPIWSCVPKGEYKDKQDILANKIRLFLIPPYELLYEQIRFGKRVSIRMKNYLWSAYGFNPYNGGTNQLAIQLKSKRNRIFYDVSGWDKFLCIMRDYYKIVEKRGSFDPTTLTEFRWTAINTYDFIFKTPFGDVFRKMYGNPSGSGVTTRDNTCCHIILFAAMLAECYYIKNEKFPPFPLIMSQVAKIFGDDIVASVDDDFDHICSPGYISSFFARFGMKTKYCVAEKDLDIEKMDFLGFKFTLKNNTYLPVYDIVRLSTSFIYKGQDDGSDDPFIARAFTLMVMSYPTEHYAHFKKGFQSICDFFTNSPKDYSNTVYSYLSLRNLPDIELQKMFTGFESNLSDLLIFF